MEKTIKQRRLPNTDSVEELAGFWDKHDLTDFADELQEVREPVFLRAKGACVSIELPPTKVQQLKRIARSKGVKEATVVRQWIMERLRESSATRRAPHIASQPAARKPQRGGTLALGGWRGHPALTMGREIPRPR